MILISPGGSNFKLQQLLFLIPPVHSPKTNTLPRWKSAGTTVSGRRELLAHATLSRNVYGPPYSAGSPTHRLSTWHAPRLTLQPRCSPDLSSLPKYPSPVESRPPPGVFNASQRPSAARGDISSDTDRAGVACGSFAFGGYKETRHRKNEQTRTRKLWIADFGATVLSGVVREG